MTRTSCSPPASSILSSHYTPLYPQITQKASRVLKKHKQTSIYTQQQHERASFPFSGHVVNTELLSMAYSGYEFDAGADYGVQGNCCVQCHDHHRSRWRKYSGMSIVRALESKGNLSLLSRLTTLPGQAFCQLYEGSYSNSYSMYYLIMSLNN